MLTELAAVEVPELAAAAECVPLRVVADGVAVVAAAEAGTEVIDAVEAVMEAPVEAAPAVMVTGTYMDAMSAPVKAPVVVPRYGALTPPMVSTQSATFGLLKSHLRWTDTLQNMLNGILSFFFFKCCRDGKETESEKNLQVLVMILEFGGFGSLDRSQTRRDTALVSGSAGRTIDEESGG